MVAPLSAARAWCRPEACHNPTMKTWIHLIHAHARGAAALLASDRVLAAAAAAWIPAGVPAGTAPAGCMRLPDSTDTRFLPIDSHPIQPERRCGCCLGQRRRAGAPILHSAWRCLHERVRRHAPASREPDLACVCRSAVESISQAYLEPAACPSGMASPLRACYRHLISAWLRNVRYTFSQSSSWEVSRG